MSRKRTGEKVVQSLFGATLAEQGKGYYVALELFALLKGTEQAHEKLLPSLNGPIAIRRRAHDFARRLMADPCALADSEREALGQRTFETLRALSLGLRVPIPGRRKRPNWLGEHLFPYVGELIHYDAAPRSRRQEDHVPTEFRVSIETYLYRGAGGLAHKILRSDPDVDRLARNRRGLSQIIEDSSSPLGKLYEAMLKHDLGREDGSFTADSESEARVHKTKWIDLLRSGVMRLVEHNRPTAKTVESLMYWVPYCIARHQLELACARVGEPAYQIPISVSESRSIRRTSREVHEKSRSVIHRALMIHAQEVQPEAIAPGASVKWRDASRNFFSGTLGTVGGLNAMQGQRHFTLRPQLLESIVLAMLDRREMAFDEFCESILFEGLDLVVDRRSAARSEQLSQMNRTDFEANAKELASILESLGLLHQYSDMTRMVRAEVI